MMNKEETKRKGGKREDKRDMQIKRPKQAKRG